MQQKLSELFAFLARWLKPSQKLSPRLLLTVVISLLLALLLPLPRLLLDGLLFTSWLSATLWLIAAVWAGEPLRLPQLPTLLLLTLLGRLCLTLALGRQAVASGQPGLLAALLQSTMGASEVSIGLLLLFALLVAQYVLLARGGERVAEVAARFVLDAMPGRQAAIDADVRQGALGVVEAQAARAELTREAELYGSLDGVLRLLRGDVLLSVLLWLGIGVAQMVSLSQTSELPTSEAAQQAARLVIGVGLATQLPVMLVTTAAVLLLLRSTSATAPSDGATMGPTLRVIASAAIQHSEAQLVSVVERLLAHIGLGSVGFVIEFAPLTGTQFRVMIHGALLAQRTVLSNERPDAVLQTMLYDLAAQLLSLDGLRKEIAKIGSERPALVSEVVPKRLPLGRLLWILRRLLSERVWPLPIAAVLETISTLPELDADADGLIEQVRSGLGPYLLSGFWRNERSDGENGLPVLVLSSDVEDVLRDARRSGGGTRLALEPDLRQEIIDAVLTAKTRAPYAVLLCQKDLRRHVESLLAATPQALPVLAYSELPPQLPLLVISRVGPGTG
ncbi:MAG TPA: FHIPEP family type III secretion protein [Pseudomonadota bacterium]|nr:FHIPEP family type III secretion protein [Pseudomonadota bacterium]